MKVAQSVRSALLNSPKMIIYAVNPLFSTHIRPLAGLKSRSVFQSLLIQFQDGIAFSGMEVQHPPRDGKMFISQTQKPTEGQDRVGHLARPRVDDYILNLSQIFLGRIYYLRANNRRFDPDDVISLGMAIRERHSFPR